MIATQTIDELNRDFSAGGAATFEAGQGGLTRAVVRAREGEAHIYTHGAHVTHWQPAGAKPVLWVSKGSWFGPEKPIRGGVPVCLPWFGPHPTDKDAPNHGWARLLPWRVESVQKQGDGSVSLRLTIARDDFAFTHEIIVGKTLAMTLVVRNTSAQPAYVTEALHTYFSVSDVRKISVEGLEGVTYLSKVEGGRFASDKPVTFTRETDRVYFGTDASCQLRDPGLGRTIIVSKKGSASTVVWNPWIEKSAAMPDFGNDEWPGMVCIETANALDDAITLAPGEEHRMTAHIEVR